MDAWELGHYHYISQVINEAAGPRNVSLMQEFISYLLKTCLAYLSNIQNADSSRTMPVFCLGPTNSKICTWNINKCDRRLWHSAGCIAVFARVSWYASSSNNESLPGPLLAHILLALFSRLPLPVVTDTRLYTGASPPLHDSQRNIKWDLLKQSTEQEQFRFDTVLSSKGTIFDPYVYSAR